MTTGAVFRHFTIEMTPNVIAIGIVLTLLSAAALPTAVAQDPPPLQVNARVHASNAELAASFQRRIRPGDATMSARVRNLPGGETARVVLDFDYETEADFALDEIISLIVISIENANGKEVSRATIDPNEVNLNPNRVPLHYSATLYRPPQAAAGAGYIVHVRLFGNYE